MIGGIVGVREAEIGPAGHAEPLHQAPTRRIGRNGEGDDAAAVEMGPGPAKRGLRRLPGIALPPRVLAQAPADFHLAVDRRSRHVGALETAEAEQRTVGLALDRPEAVAVFALASFEAS